MRIVKSQLKIQLGNARSIVDELLIIVLEIKRILNKRPNTHDLPTDLDKCLTRNNLLFGRRLKAYLYRDNFQTESISQVTYSKHLMLYLTNFGTDG